jgi:hypothetical protein
LNCVQIPDGKKPLKDLIFQGLDLVAGTRKQRFLRSVEQHVPKLAA